MVSKTDARIYRKSRSSYFHVTSGSGFEKMCEKWGLEILYGESGIRAGKFGFIISDGNKQKGRSIHKFKKELSALLERFTQPFFHLQTFLETSNLQSYSGHFSNSFPQTFFLKLLEKKHEKSPNPAFFFTALRRNLYALRRKRVVNIFSTVRLRRG